MEAGWAITCGILSGSLIISFSIQITGYIGISQGSYYQPIIIRIFMPRSRINGL
jgi:hypothetical protein